MASKSIKSTGSKKASWWGISLISGLLLVFFLPLAGLAEAQEQAVELIVRGDDMGMTHSANEAFELAFKRGIITCGGLIVPSPWFEDAVSRCLEHRDWSVGVHLCVNAEWKTTAGGLFCL